MNPLKKHFKLNDRQFFPFYHSKATRGISGMLCTGDVRFAIFFWGERKDPGSTDW